MTTLTREEAAALVKIVDFILRGESIFALLTTTEQEAARSGYQKLRACFEDQA